jgi:hypothetical protein
MVRLTNTLISQCDGAKPSCSTCTTIYKSECYYDIDNDNRRKGALRKSIRQLEAHSEDLETILDGIKEGSEADADDIVHLIRTNEDEPYESIAESIRQMHVTPLNEAGAPILKGELIHLGLSSQENVHRTRHYGHTSAFAFVTPEPEISKTAAGQSETWTTVTNDWEFVKHLLFLYFTWAHPFYVLFDEEIFWHGYENQKLKYCSPLLLNAILALACNYSDRPETRSDPTDPKTVGDHFFAEAKRLLAEDERSCLTTVQALGVMSIRQAMNNHDSSGWLYRGKMMAMAVEMGLHLTYNGPPTKDLSPAEVEVRRITFWGCFVLETAWAISVGRISALPRTAIQLEKPVLTESLEGKIWMPYTDDNTPQFLSKYAQPKLTYNVLNQLSLLSEIVSDTVQMFYAPREPTTSRRLLQHHSRFQQWYSNLPMLLAVRQDAPTLPQILSLQ